MNRSGLSNITIPYIFIQLANGFSLVWDDKERERRGPNYFVSLSHKRIATAYEDKQVGTASLQINYVPLIDEDPDFVEKELIDSGGVMFFRYGHSQASSGKMYKALTKTYSVTVSGGVVSLNISLVSCAVAFVKYQGCFAWSNLIDAGLGSVLNTPYYSPTNSDIAAKYDTPISRDVLARGLKRYIDNALGGEYEFDEAGSEFEGLTVNEIRVSGVNAIEGLTEFLRDMIVPEDDEESYYVIEFDDAVTDMGSGSTKKKIRIRRINGNSNADSDNIPNYTYKYNSKDCDIISFSTSYAGEVAIYSGRPLIGDFYYNVVLKEDENGDFYEEAYKDWSPSRPHNLTNNRGISDKQMQEEASYWRSRFQIAIYKATVQVLGVSTSEDIHIGSKIQVNIFVGNRTHHTSGVYQVLGITDSVSSSGFTTTYDLVKAKQSDAEKYLNSYNQYVNTD